MSPGAEDRNWIRGGGGNQRELELVSNILMLTKKMHAILLV